MSKFAIGSRINHKYWGHGTVTGESIAAGLGRFTVPVRYDDSRVSDGNYESNMEQIPALKPEFAVGDRVYHEHANKNGTVISAEFQKDGETNVTVAWDDGWVTCAAYTKNLSMIAPAPKIFNDAPMYTQEQYDANADDAFGRGEKVGFDKGHDAAFGSILATRINQAFDAAPVPDNTKTTAQLLNELYHDRARLEKVIKDHVVLAEDILANAAADNKLSQTGSKLKGALVEFVRTNR